MDVSLMLMICTCAAVVIALVFIFFGYRFARLLMPICGVLVLETALYVFVYDMLNLNALNTWLFFCGSSIAIYVLLFLIKRLAGFFVGALGTGLLVTYIVYAFKLSGISYFAPACLTICMIAGLLTAVYNKVGVVIFTSMFGACVAVFVGSFLVVQGFSTGALMAYGNILVPLEQHLATNAYLIGGASLGVAVVGFLVQSLATAGRQVLSSSFDDDARLKKTNKKSGSTNTFVENDSASDEKVLGFWDEGI